MVFFLIVALIIVVLALILAVQNVEPVAIRFLIWTLQDLPLSVALLSAFVLGALVSWLVSLPRAIKRGLTIATQKRKIGELEKLQAEAKAKAEAKAEKPSPPMPKEPPEPEKPSEPEQL